MHQHFSLVDALTVWENVALGEAGRLDPAAIRTRIGEIADGFPDQSANPRESQLTAYTDSRGNFQLTDLPSGIYEVAVEPDSLPNWLTPKSRPKVTALVSDRDRAAVHLAVTTFAELVGQVRREEGGLVRGGNVEVYRKGEPNPFDQCELDDRGRFSIRGLDRGVDFGGKRRWARDVIAFQPSFATPGHRE